MTHWTDRLTGEQLLELQAMRLDAAMEMGLEGLKAFLEETRPREGRLEREREGEEQEKSNAGKDVFEKTPSPAPPPQKLSCDEGVGPASVPVSRRLRGTRAWTPRLGKVKVRPETTGRDVGPTARRKTGQNIDIEVKRRGVELLNAGNALYRVFRMLQEEFGDRAPLSKSTVDHWKKALLKGVRGGRMTQLRALVSDHQDPPADRSGTARRAPTTPPHPDPLPPEGEREAEGKLESLSHQDVGAQRAVPDDRQEACPTEEIPLNPPLEKGEETENTLGYPCPSDEPVGAQRAVPGAETSETPSDADTDHLPDVTEMIEPDPVGAQRAVPEEAEELPQANVQPCRRESIPLITPQSCMEWQARWRAVGVEPKRAWEKLRDCRDCDQWVEHPEDLPIKADPSTPTTQPRSVMGRL